MKVFTVAESKEQQKTLANARTRGRRAADYLGLERNVVVVSAVVFLLGFGEELWKVVLQKNPNYTIYCPSNRFIAATNCGQNILCNTTIERASNSTNVTGDLVISGLSLANTGDSLELQDAAGARVDVVNSAGGAWFAGTTTGYYTMERRNPVGGGDDPLNWANNNGVTRNGRDSGKKFINGTPRAKNSATP